MLKKAVCFLNVEGKEKISRIFFRGGEQMGRSRNENILESTINGEEYSEEPKSRIEELLIELKEVIEAGGGGGGTVTGNRYKWLCNNRIYGFKWYSQFYNHGTR